MILCSCSGLTKAAIKSAAEALTVANPSRPVTPGRVFLALGARPQCGSCVELIRATLRDLGFALTCPEPLATVAETRIDGAPLPDEEEWWAPV
jgi:bacterioferritin-associated ferredoxin